MFDLRSAVPGVDLSHHDDDRGRKPIRYDDLAKAVGWAILRVGDGGDTDRSFRRHAAALNGRVALGTYLFCRPGREPVRQAKEWAAAIRELTAQGVTFPLGHWADLEDDDDVGRAATTTWIGAFLAAADAAMGAPVEVYTSASWWQSHVDGTPPAGRRWWVARYPWQLGNGSSIGEPPPFAPREWPAYVANRARPRTMPKAPADNAVTIWQWSSIGPGTVLGTHRERALDINLFDGTAFSELTGKQATKNDLEGDMPGSARLYRDTRFANIWLVGNGPPLHLSPGLLKTYTDADFEMVEDEHEQTLTTLLTQCGMQRTDLVPM